MPSCISDIISLLDTKSTSPNYYTELTCYPNGGRQFEYNADMTQAALVGNKPVFDLREEYSALLPAAKEILGIFRAREPIQAQINILEGNINTQRDQYSTALQEKEAAMKPVYSPSDTAATLAASEASLEDLKAEVAQHNTKIATLRSENTESITALKAEVKTIETAYNREHRWWTLKVDLLSFLFAGLVFGLLYALYSRFKKDNSPHTIIFTVATFAYGVLLLQVVLVGIWDLIPHVFIEKLINFLRNFSPILYLLQFLIPLFLVIVFGWLVYRIQRRLFSRENILKRIVADRRCPHCHNTIDIDKPFCPLCDYEIQIECPSCHKLTIKGMPFCSNCGKNL